MPDFMSELLRLTGQYQDPFKKAAAESPFRQADRDRAILFGTNTSIDTPRILGVDYGTKPSASNGIMEKINSLKQKLGDLRNRRAAKRAKCLAGNKPACAVADAIEDEMRMIEKEIEELKEQLKESRMKNGKEAPAEAAEGERNYGDSASASGSGGSTYSPNPHRPYSWRGL